MEALRSIRRRFSPRPRDASTAPTSASAAADAIDGGEEAPPVPAGEAGPPFSGYERLDVRQVINSLSDHSQAELEGVESYERSHESRKPVLDKLHYMRGSEPLPGYDALTRAEVVTALGKADPVTIKKVRGYERKFANRTDVMEEVVRALHRRQAIEPTVATPAYQPVSASAGASRPAGRTKKAESA